MAALGDSAEHAGGKLGGHGVGIAMIAIFAGMALVVAFAASDGAIFGQNFQSAPSEDVPVSNSGAEDAVALSRDAFNEGPGVDSSSATAPPPEDGATLSEEERRLLAMKDFPWDSVAGGQIASNQDAFQRFGQQSVTQQRPVEPGTEPLSMSDQVVVDVDRRDRDDSDRDTLPAGIIEIDIPIGDDDDEDQQEEVDEQPDDAPEDDQEEEPQNDDAENDQGSDEETGDDSSGEGSGEGDSGSGSGDDQSGVGDSSGSNSTGTSDPSEDSGSESDADGDNSTGTQVTVSLG